MSSKTAMQPSAHVLWHLLFVVVLQADGADNAKVSAPDYATQARPLEGNAGSAAVELTGSYRTGPLCEAMLQWWTDSKMGQEAWLSADTSSHGTMVGSCADFCALCVVQQQTAL